jgi:hypothetical protein
MTGLVLDKINKAERQYQDGVSMVADLYVECSTFEGLLSLIALKINLAPKQEHTFYFFQ